MITLQERVHKVPRITTWSLNKLHHIFFIRKNNKNIGMIEDNLLSLSYGRIKTKDIASNEGLLPESFETYQIVEIGDIVLRLTDLQNDKRSIRQGLVKERGIVTSAYDAVYVKDENCARYWAYMLLSLDLAKYYYSLGGGVRQSIKFSDFPNDWLSVPSPKLQIEISDFLDIEVNRIDSLIIEKKKQILLLNERLLSIVKDKVSKGLDHTVQFKPSNLFYLENVPKHWKLIRLKRALKIQNGQDYKSVESLSGYPVIGSGGQFTFASEFLYSGEAVLIGRKGTINKPMYINEAFWTVDTMFYGIPQKGYNCKYIYYCAKAIPFEFYSTDTAIPSNTQSNLNNHIIAVPDIAEQIEIANFLDSKTTETVKLIESIKKSINNLGELRISLITEAVTGKLNINWDKRVSKNLKNNVNNNGVKI